MRGEEDIDRVSAELESIDNPLRLEILTRLTLKPASAKELAEQLDAPPGKVRYQLDRLRQTGLAELKEERQRRGVTERVYYVRAQPLDGAEFARLSEAEREKMVAGITKLVLGDVLKGMRDGAFAARDDFVIARMPLSLDEKGWEDAARVHRDALEKLLRIREESWTRFETEGNPTSEAFSFLLLFEVRRSHSA